MTENYFKGIGFFNEKSYYPMKLLWKKDLLLLTNKLIAKIPDPFNAKKQQPIIYNKEKYKISKIIRKNNLSTENFWKPKHITLNELLKNIQIFNINYPRLQDLSKVSSNRSLQNNGKKVKTVLKKNM